MAGIDELFTKRLPISLKFTDRENRKTSINIAVEVHTTPTPVHRKELVVRLTDETDLFFLYTLKLSEEDFQSLKTQQGLLVDFGAFPQKFIDLLELCLQEKEKENPKFVLDLVANGSSSSCTANLNVVETNPFKHLTHLSLKFLPGTDTDIKKYLAHCLKVLKDQNTTLVNRLEQTESELSTQLRQTREALANRTQELDSLKSQWSANSSDKDVRHRQELTSEKEKALQIQTEQQQKYEREKRELEQSHVKIVKQLEARLYEMEAANKDLTDKRYKSESTIRELKAKLSTLEEEHHHARQELQSLRKDNAGLDSNYHEQDKVITQLRTRLAVLEQEVKDKEEVKRKTTDLYSSEQEQKRKLEEDLERKKRNIAKLEASIKTMSEELVKANEIIKKFQGDIKTYHSKLKLRDQVNIEQEKLLGEKNKEMEEIRKELEQAKTTNQNKEEEVKKLNDNLQMTMQKLDESRQLLKTNENVINWLNKQVTENQLARTGHGAGAFEMNSTGSASRALHNYSAPNYGPPSSRLSTSIRSEPPPHAYHRPHPQSSIPHPASAALRGQYVQYQPGQGATKSTLPVPMAKSSPIGAIPEERQSPQASPLHPSNQSKPRTSASEPLIDNRYLQRTDEIPLREAPRSVTPNHTSLHFTAQQASVPSSTQPIRLSKDAILSQRPSGVASTGQFATNTVTAMTHGHTVGLSNHGNTGLTGSHNMSVNSVGKQSQPPLASAYFPTQGKVT